MIQPAEEVDYLEAERKLKTHLKSKKRQIIRFVNWSRWYYTDDPFWAVFVETFGINFISYKFSGFHIHDDGEIIEIDISYLPCPLPAPPQADWRE